MNKSTVWIWCIALALIPMNLHSQNKGKKEVVILAESDVHGAGDGYAVMAFLRDSLRSRGDNVLLASCGDFLSGGFLAVKSRGGSVIRIMNAVGYDAVALGNHEFDYGLSRMRSCMGELTCPALCCNIMEDGRPVLGNAGYTIVTAGGVNVAFIGVTTAETRYKASPAEFKGVRKERYDFFVGDSLAKVVQRCVDEARSKGANYVVLLCHLGNKGGETAKLVSSLTGITAIVNAHDHELVNIKLPDAAGDSIPCIATENAFRHIVKLTLRREDCAVEILSVSDEREKGHFDRGIDSLVGSELGAYGASLIVGSSKASLLSEKEGNVHLSRLGETNAGDFVADAFLHVAREKVGPTDIAIINGGGVRGNIPSGDITKEGLYDLTPLPNRLYVISLSGDSLRGMLRRMTRVWPKKSGSFPQISGITFTLDSTTVDRVSNVRIKDGDSWADIEPLRRYLVATTDYLTFGGDSVFDNIPAIVDSTGLYMDSVLSLYLEACDGVIDSCYSKPQDRIVVKCKAAELRRLGALEGFILLNIVLLLIFMRRKRGDPFYMQLFGIPAYVAAIMTGVLWLTVLDFVVIFAATRQGIRLWYN